MIWRDFQDATLIAVKVFLDSEIFGNWENVYLNTE
jgi:hypothetical protein